MKINKFLMALGLAAGLSMSFTGCGGESDSNDDTDSGTNSVGSLSTVSGATLGAANTTTAAALEAFFDTAPDELFEDVADEMVWVAYMEEDTSSSPFSYTYQCSTSGTLEISGTYHDNFEVATATIKANDCVDSSYYVDEVDGTFYYAMNDAGVTYEAKTDVVFDYGYYGAGTFSQGSSVVYTNTSTDAITANVNVEYVDAAGKFYRVEGLTYDGTLDAYDDMDSIDLNGARIYVSETSYVDYVSDTLTMGTYGPVGDVVFSAADSGELTVTFSTYGSATATVTADSTTSGTTDTTLTYEGTSSSPIALTVGTAHSGKVGDGSDYEVSTSYYTFTTTDAGDYTMTITDSNAKMYLYTGEYFTGLVDSAYNTFTETLDASTTYYLKVINEYSNTSDVTYDLTVAAAASSGTTTTVSGYDLTAAIDNAVFDSGTGELTVTYSLTNIGDTDVPTDSLFTVYIYTTDDATFDINTADSEKFLIWSSTVANQNPADLTSGATVSVTPTAFVPGFTGAERTTGYVWAVVDKDGDELANEANTSNNVSTGVSF